MKTVIAVKAIGKTKPGGRVNLPANMARALVALGHAAYAPKPVPVKTRQYQRRDMVAEAPRSVAPITGTITTPAARAQLSAPSVARPDVVFYTPPVDDGKA